ncbi:MAG: dipeptide epimerase [Actinomycetota bacterium]|nr:dipeptide epimerase [Actinomycetota bacterium]
MTANWDVYVKAIDLPLAEKFVIARESWYAASNVFVAVAFGDEFGVGEVSPDAHWGETVQSVITQLENVDLKLMSSPFELEVLSYLLPAGSARSALDMAMHDLAAKMAGISVRQLVGLDDTPKTTSVTIPITETSRMVQRAMLYSDHPTLKMKVGFEGDVEAVAAVRKVFKGEIRVDANEGWTTTEAVTKLRRLQTLNIELCEQPIPAGNHDDLRFVSACTSIPVFADEDVSTAQDVAKLVGVVDGVNLKLRKAGGIREIIRAATVARAHGMGLMIGCDLESGIATTAGAQIASLFDFVDMDGAMLLANDPYPGVRYRRGLLELPEGRGLGVKKTPW